MTRVWDAFLTHQDQQLVARNPRKSVGFGKSPAVLMIDNYRWVIGDEPQPLLEPIEKWPSSTGLDGWEALEHIQRLLKASRSAGIPIVHVTGLGPESGVAPLNIHNADEDRTSAEQRARKFEIVAQAAPIPCEAVLRKSHASAFFGTPLVSHLNSLGVDTLIVGGEATSGCVRASVVDAAAHWYRVIVAEECVYDRTEASHAINLFDMHRKFADVLPLDDILDWIEGYSPQPERTA
jgi:maleamate amidohydrolase